MKLRYWQQPDLPPPKRLIAVPPAHWLTTLSGGAGGKTRVIWRMAGHRTMAQTWRNGPRTLGEHLIYLISDGGPVSLELDEQRLVLQPGTFMWLAPGVHHCLAATDEHQPVTLYHIRFCVRRGDGDLWVKPESVVLPDAHETHWELEQIVRELFEQKADVAVRCAALLSSLSVTVFRMLTQAATSDAMFSGAQLGRLLEYARIHAAQWPRPADLAAQVRLSPAYFSRVFRKSFGRSPRTWLCEQRIHEAARLLVESNLNVNQVADQMGYRDVFLFSRQFKQVTGMSPTSYRRSF